MRRPFLLLAVLVFGFGPEAALTKYKDWPKSAEANYLTAKERDEWKLVRTDDDAVAFIARFRQRHGGLAFTDMVTHRAGIADRFFSSSDRKGSETLRGKMVIFFGAPSGISSSRLLTRRDPYVPPTMPVEGVTYLRPPPGASNTRGARHAFWLTTLRFPADRVPAFNGTDYIVTVEVEADDNADKLAKGFSAKDLDKLFDAAIAASVVKP